MTSCQTLLTSVGLTHAARVMAEERWSDEESTMSTRLLVPLNDKALPYFPDGDQVAPIIVPRLLFPEASITVDPAPSLNVYWATSPVVAAGVVVKVKSPE